MEDTVYNVTPSADGRIAAVQLANGQVLKFLAEDKEVRM